MSRVYVSGSVHDTLRACAAMQELIEAGHEIAHDWTEWPGPKDGPDAWNEATRQLEAITTADVLVLLVDPRLKAGWMEFGAAVASGIPIVVVPDPDVSASLWYVFENVWLLGDHTLAYAVGRVA